MAEVKYTAQVPNGMITITATDEKDFVNALSYVMKSLDLIVETAPETSLNGKSN